MARGRAAIKVEAVLYLSLIASALHPPAGVQPEFKRRTGPADNNFSLSVLTLLVSRPRLAYAAHISTPPYKETSVRCLVIEDEADTSRYICAGLRAAGHDVTACDNGIDGMRLACGEEWDAVVLDRLLPGEIDGLAIVARLRGMGRNTPVLVLSALSSVDERVRGLRSGGDDYLSKPFAIDELLARLEALLRRAAPVPDATQLQVADLVLDMRTMRVTRANRQIALQPREFRLLEYLMRNRGQSVTRAMLLEAVWDYHFDPQTNVIDVQVSRLRTKIDKEFSPPLIHTVRGVGYTLDVLDNTQHG